MKYCKRSNKDNQVLFYSFINTVLKLEEEYWWKIKINIKINKYKPTILITCKYAQAQLKFLQINETFTKTPQKIPAYTVQNIMLLQGQKPHPLW